MIRSVSVLLGILLLAAGCSNKEIVPERFYPRNDHEAYWYSLKQANLLTTALGNDWIQASTDPFQKPITIQFPYQEAFHLSAQQPEALGFSFSVKRGQKVLVDIQAMTSDSSRLFIDLFRLTGDSLNPYFHVATADSSLHLGFEARREADYLLRIQPELLRGGNYALSINNVPSLLFPVAGKDKQAIRSFFGDPRDGGRREHHGVDIFARRHTPIIAPVAANVGFVGTRGIGGKVVWLHDPRTGNHLYFAHLESQSVKRFDRVQPGDTIGTVGNTGNARTTPPHLHFGIYNRGPINPFDYISQLYAPIEYMDPDTAGLGRKVILESPLVLSRHMNDWVSSDTLQTGAKVRVSGINHAFVRLTLPSGQSRFLQKKDLTF